jgi:hypothetical protein
VPDDEYKGFRVWMERRFKKVEDALESLRHEMKYEHARLLREFREVMKSEEGSDVAEGDAEGDAE